MVRRRGSVIATDDAKKWRIVASSRSPAGARKQVWRTVHGTRREAEKALTALLREVDTGLATGDRVTLGAWMNRWLDLASRQVKPTTARSYRQHVRDWINPVIGRTRLTELRPDHVDMVTSTILGKGRSSSTARRVYATLRRALTVAERRGMIPVNVARNVEPPREAAVKRRVRPDAITRVLELSSGDRIHPLLCFLFATGLRRGEAQGLRWENVDLDRGTVRVVETAQRLTGRGFVVSTPKSRTSRRTVHLDADTIQLLRERLGEQSRFRIKFGAEWNPLDLVWTGATGSYFDPERLTKGFKRYARLAGHDELRLHDLRHAHATALVELNAHPRTIQQRLGHSSAAFTMNVYASDNDALDAEAATAFGQRFGSSHPRPGPEEIEVSLETR